MSKTKIDPRVIDDLSARLSILRYALLANFLNCRSVVELPLEICQAARALTDSRVHEVKMIGETIRARQHDGNDLSKEKVWAVVEILNDVDGLISLTLNAGALPQYDDVQGNLIAAVEELERNAIKRDLLKT